MALSLGRAGIEAAPTERTLASRTRARCDRGHIGRRILRGGYQRPVNHDRRRRHRERSVSRSDFIAGGQMGASLEAPLTRHSVHLCVDMQRLFSADGPWPTPWMERVLPNVAAIAERFPERTVFTRFMTPVQPEDMPGTWQRYYGKWHEATRKHLDSRLLELMPRLARLAPPAHVIDKTRYSAFALSGLAQHLQARGADALVITGSETDVCVLATVLGAVDCGFRVVIVTDGACSASDEGHDCLLAIYRRRYSMQIETADSATVLSCWA
jgi:nicotinamidase-related amidase